MNDYKALTIFGLFISLFLLGAASFFGDGFALKISQRAKDVVAGTFFKESVDDVELKERFEMIVENDKEELYRRRRKGLNNEPIKILIVPGHDEESSGAFFNGVREVDLNRDVAKNLYNYLKDEKGFVVMLAHDGKEYSKELQEYFNKEEDDIRTFQSEYKQIMNDLVQKRKVDLVNGVFHNAAPNDVALKLYGINKYVNDKKFDIVMHIHFNDYPGRKGSGGKYSGFAIYVPEAQFSNARASKEFASHLHGRLRKILPPSNLPQESVGVVEDQELIAIGAYNTVDAVSVLIEYGYIYEGQYTDPVLRKPMMKELAYQTYGGIKSFFDVNMVDKDTTLVNSHIIETNLKEGDRGTSAILGLQALLRLTGHYPPKGKNLNDCPLSGIFGPCTRQAVESYQKDNNINPTGYVGELTRKNLEKDILEI